MFGGLFATAGWAQESAPGSTPTKPETKKAERIEITGSRIKRIDSETSAPVQVITREQIERSGATSVTELLKRAPASNAGSFDENAIASFTPGAGGVSLRGMGAQATLILINGRRVTPYGFASGGQTTFVDVNSIPLDAIERVEILLDSASAVYGSEAMAGVINIILRKDFTGYEANAGYGVSSEGDAARKHVGVTAGFGSPGKDNYNLLFSLEHQENDPLRADQRPNSSTADYSRFGLPDRRSSYSYPGNLYGPGFLGPMAGCTTVDNNPSSPLNGRCVYDQAKHQDLISRQERDALFVSGVLDMTPNTQLFGDLIINQTRGDQNSVNYNSAQYGLGYIYPGAGIPLSADHPQNPFGQDVQLRYRFADVPDSVGWKSDNQRLTLGVKANEFAGWDLESALVYSHSETTIKQRGLIRDSVLANEVMDPATGYARNNFYFGDPSKNDPGLMARLYPELTAKGETSLTSIDVRGTRELMQLAGGPMAVALGAEVRHETFVSNPDPLVAAGEISVLGGSSSDGSRTASAIYAELSAPVTKTLEAQIAGRVDRYPSFGTNFTPKLGAKWKILPKLALRGTYSEGFRAPALTELVQSPTVGFYSGLRDPALCADPTDTSNPNCDVSVKAISGSNPNLKPEKSKGYTLGVVFEPIETVSATLDAYQIERTHEITTLAPDYLLANESRYSGYVVRDPVTGVLNELHLPYENLGSTKLTGYDLDLKSRFSLGEYGKLATEILYSYLPHYKVRPVEGAAEEEWAGTYNQPKERASFRATWDKAAWSVGLQVNYVGGFLRAYSPSDLSCPYANEALCRVDSWTTTDINVRYRGFKDWVLNAAVDNISNKQPPIDERQMSWYSLYNAGYHNALGRYFRVSAKYSFK